MNLPRDFRLQVIVLSLPAKASTLLPVAFVVGMADMRTKRKSFQVTVRVHKGSILLFVSCGIAAGIPYLRVEQGEMFIIDDPDGQWPVREKTCRDKVHAWLD